MASGHLGGKICLWDAITGAKRRTPRGHSEEVVSLSFSPNSSVLVSASDDMTIRFWNSITVTKVTKYRRRHRVRCAAFMPDGKKIIFVQSPGSISLWDVIENKKCGFYAAVVTTAPKATAMRQYPLMANA
ncbi:WD40-repeat-containing domain protein [Trichoderma compactum]